MHLGHQAQFFYSLIIILAKLKERRMSLPPTRKTISHFTYNLKDKLGEGFSSEVFKGADQHTGLPVAIKVVSKVGSHSSEQLELAETQIHALDLLKGSCNILQLKQALQTKNSIYIISEYCSKGTLRALLKHRKRLSQAEAIGYIMQVIRGYRSIYQRGLLHRDIKPDNILLTEQGEVRIGDFGFAIAADKCRGVMGQNIGTPLFMPYETLARSQYSPKSDIWAIGITFLEMITGRSAWKANTQKELITELENFQIDAILPKAITEGSQTFLRRALERDVEVRMDPQELFSFNFDCQVVKYHSGKNKLSLKKSTSLEVIYERQLIQRNPNKMPPQMPAKVKIAQQKSEKSTEEQSKTDFERMGEIQSGQTMESVKKIASQKNINSFDNIDDIPVKNKEGLLRKYSEMKNDCIHRAETVQSIFLKEGPQPQKVKLTLKMEREALMEIQCQINYFRFIFKLFKKINDTIKTADTHIKRLKHNLLYTAHSKIDQIQQLEGCSLPEEVRQEFKKTPEFANVLQVLSQYRERYSKETEKAGVLGLCDDEKGFIRELRLAIRVLNQNVCCIEQNHQEFHKKKSLVLIISDLVHLNRIYLLERQHNWALFHRDSDIASIVEKPAEVGLQSLHCLWSGLKQHIKQLICI